MENEEPGTGSTPASQPPLAPSYDCLPCRIIGGGAAISLGSYALYQKRQLPISRVPGSPTNLQQPALQRAAVSILGWGLIALGIRRLFFDGSLQAH